MRYGYEYTYEYDYPTNYGAEAGVFISIMLLTFTVIVLLALASYIFRSIGLYTIGKRMGKDYPWLAFIPFARNYFHGELAGEITLKNTTIKNPGIWNLTLPIIESALLGIFIFFIAIIGGFSAASVAAGMGSVGIGLSLIIWMYIFLIMFAIVMSAARIVLSVLINRQIFGRFTCGNMAVVHSVLSITIPLYEAFCLFVMRNKEFNAGMEQKTE